MLVYQSVVSMNFGLHVFQTQLCTLPRSKYEAIRPVLPARSPTTVTYNGTCNQPINLTQTSQDMEMGTPTFFGYLLFHDIGLPCLCVCIYLYICKFHLPCWYVFTNAYLGKY